MMQKLIKRHKMSIIALSVILLLLGIIGLIHRDTLSLKAEESHDDYQLVQIKTDESYKSQLKIDGIPSTELPIDIELTAKKDVHVKLPYNSNFSVKLLDSNKKELAYATYTKSTQNTDETSLVNLENEDQDVFKIEKNKFTGEIFFKMKKKDSFWIQIQRNTDEAVDVSLADATNTKKRQTIFSFKERIPAPILADNKKQEQVEEPQADGPSVRKVGNDIPNEVTTENKDGENKKNSFSEIGTSLILEVDTVETEKSLKELTNQKIGKTDSLIAPKVRMESSESKGSKSDKSPIIFREAKVVTKTGTSTFDVDDKPGYDSSDTNDIVRSFDSVNYLLSFTVQNNDLNVKYTKIKYRVKTQMANAVELSGRGVPINVGEIVNGSYVDNGDGTQDSVGIMESVINETGQIFVPITLDVLAAKQGTSLQPTIELELVEAMNTNSGEVEVFNAIYDSTKLPNLELPVTTVSAKPSINVQLVQGEVKSNTTLGSTDTNQMAYDVGAITTLQPLSGRATGDYRGSAFPSGPITYTIKTTGKYRSNAGVEHNLTSAQYDPFYVEKYAPAVVDRSTGSWLITAGGIAGTKIDDFSRPLSAPHAKTGSIYTSQPTGDLSKIGVYDAGDFSVTRGGAVSNTNYEQTYNPYTYNMTGLRAPSATAKSFSSLEMILSWNQKKTMDLAKTNGWSRFEMRLSVDSISYDGVTTSNSTNIDYPTVYTSNHGYFASTAIFNELVGGRWGLQDDGFAGLAPGGIRVGNATPGAEMNIHNYGNAQISSGSRVWFGSYSWIATPSRVSGSEHMTTWDPKAFQYDSSQRPSISLWSTKNQDYHFEYGVAKNLVTTPPYTMKVNKVENDRKLYDWYATPEAAEAVGPISSVALLATYDHNPLVWDDLELFYFVPTIVKATSGAFSPSGKPLVALGSQKFIDREGNTVASTTMSNDEVSGGGASNGGIGTYKPTVFDPSGVPISLMTYPNTLGDTAYVKGMAVTTKTDVEKPLYQAKDEVNIRINGVTSGSDSSSYDGSLTTTLPKGVTYKPTSSIDAFGAPLPEPVIINNLDGTSVLKWTFKEIHLPTGMEVNFTVTLDQKELSFNTTGYTSNLEVLTVGELWVTGDPSIKDASKESYRSSTDIFRVEMVQQIIISKTADKPSIEVGNQDPIGEDTSITYKVSLLNESLDDVLDVRLLDVLPYDGDSRGTKFSGNYKITRIKVDGGPAIISYSNATISETTDPNSVSGWPTYDPATDPISSVENAKAILVSKPILQKNEEIILTITIQPEKQKAGDVLVNDAGMNSLLDLPVNSQAVWTRVYSRSLTGYIWYDDDYNGLIGVRLDGSPELPVADVAVKLYRTSEKDKDYANELVKQSLSGKPFIDGSGDSLITTGADGTYTFNDLPEGKYIAEFMVGDLIIRKNVIVTQKLIGSDTTKNSKADPDDYKTPEYTQPLLSELPELLGTKAVYEITDVNAGLTPLSKIRVFKYQEGTAIDDNQDGTLSDTEIEKSGHPLAGAEFDIYEGDSTKPVDLIGSATTDENGWLEFIGLPPGDYTLVETVSPEGYELIKNPIRVTVPTYNFIAIVHVANDNTTLLPFAGARYVILLTVLVAGILSLIGIGLLSKSYFAKTRK